MTPEPRAASRWKAWVVPGVPFLFSLALSLSTVGSHVFWQDSGLYLTAVHDLGVLYPPGFVTYVVLCRLWTLVFFFLEFALAVHVFSAFLGALTAGTLALAVRDLLRSRGPLFKVTSEEPGRLADASAVLVGCLAASGYTFWFASIYAKGYTLYYFVLALLLWRMIRADQSGKGRDFTIVAALIGLAWQAHPSAALLGLAPLLFVLYHRRTVGFRGIAWRTGVAAACAVGPSLVILPILVSREPWLSLGNPLSPWQVLRYVSGRRFLSIPGVFGYDEGRVASFGQFLWEEFLGIGLCLVAAGLVTLVKSNRRLLAGFAAWLVPFVAVTIAFKIEGQHDCWFVASWLPLYLALGVGAWAFGRAVGRRALPALAAAGLLGAGWAVAVNGPLLNNRNYDLAELCGQMFLEPVDRDAVLVLNTDDPLAIAGYMHRVKRVRPDVTFVRGPLLYMKPAAGSNWYDERLLAAHSFLRAPAYEEMERRFPHAYIEHVVLAAFLNANAECGRPLFAYFRPPPEMIRPDYVLVPAGALWKLVRREDEKVDLRYWKFPIDAEEVRRRYRRERGQFVKVVPGGVEVTAESYERRFVRMLLNARRALAEWLSHNGKHEQAVRIFESILRLDPEPLKEAEFAYCYALSVHGVGELSRAEPLLRRAHDLASLPHRRAWTLLLLATTYRSWQRHDRAEEHYRAALAVPGLDDATRGSLEERWKAN